MNAARVASALLLVVGCASAAPADDLLVFVGEKISVEQFQPTVEEGRILMDLAFHATYAVRKVVHGSFEPGTITFDAYDHYGRPAFEHYRHVLLFVSRHDGTFYHQKYAYFPVFQLTTGEWAVCGDPYRLEPSMRRGKLKPRDLPFGPEAYFDVSDLPAEEIETLYPKEHYELKGGRARCKRGNTVNDLFEAK